MATLTLVGGKGQFTWTISGLNNWFASNQYQSAGITTSKIPDGGANSWPEEKIVDRVTTPTNGNPPDWNNPFSVSGTATYASGDHTLYGFAQGSDGTYWPAGSGTVTISGSGGSVAYWEWSDSTAKTTAYHILTGQLPLSAGFKASVWNSLVTKVAQMCNLWDIDWKNRYANQTNTRVSAGEALTSTKYNSLLYNVMRVGGGDEYPSLVESGDEITPNHFLLLVDRINDGVDDLNWYLE